MKAQFLGNFKGRPEVGGSYSSRIWPPAFDLAWLQPFWTCQDPTLCFPGQWNFTQYLCPVQNLSGTWPQCVSPKLRIMVWSFLPNLQCAAGAVCLAPQCHIPGLSLPEWCFDGWYGLPRTLETPCLLPDWHFVMHQVRPAWDRGLF